MKKILLTLFIVASLILPIQGNADITKFGGFLPCTSDNGTLCTTSRYISTPGITATTSSTFSFLTASKPVFTDASKNLTSSGTVPIDQGGTGQTTAAAAFGALKQAATASATGVVYLEPKVNLLSNTEWKVMSQSTLENVGTQITLTDVTNGVCLTGNTQGLVIGKLFRFDSGDFNGEIYEVTAITANVSFTINDTSKTDSGSPGTGYEVTPGYIAADYKAPDGWEKSTTLRLYREFGSAYVKGLYGIKIVKGADGVEAFVWPGASSGGSQGKEPFLKSMRGRTVTLGMWVYSISKADNVKLTIYDDGTGGGNFNLSSFAPADSLTWLELTHTFVTDSTEIMIGLYLDGDSNDVVYASHPMLVLGNSIGSGNYAPKPSEIIFVDAPIALTNYTATTGVTDAIINLEAQSSGKIGKGVKSILAEVVEKSSNVADGDGLRLQTSSTNTAGFKINPQVNNITIRGDGEVGCNSDGDVYADFTNTGGGTLTSTVTVNAVRP